MAFDREPAGAVRVTFVLLAAGAGVVCLVPRQWTSAGILFAVSALLLGWHLTARRRAGRG